MYNKVKEKGDRPLITFALLAYNQERFIKEAVEGALAQTYSPLEIILSDDCSDDGTFAIMSGMVEVYRGPHTIILNRNQRNLGVLGLGGHINRVMEIARGELIVGAASDDISVPERTAKTYEAYEKSGREAKSIHSSCILIDEKNTVIGHAQRFEEYKNDLESLIDNGSRVYGCTHAWHKDVFLNFGPLPREIQNEDEVLPFRSLLIGGIEYIKDPLVYYRLHSKNICGINGRKKAGNKKELYDLEKRSALSAIQWSKCFLQDLEKINDRLDFDLREKLRRKIMKRIEVCERWLKFREGGKRERIKIIRKSIKDGMNLVGIIKLIIRFCLPEVYLSMSYIRYKNNIYRRNGGKREFVIYDDKRG